MRVAVGFSAVHGIQVRTPQKGGLEALWARAGQAGHLRLEVESARVAEQERSLAEAREHLEQWDYLVSQTHVTRSSHKTCTCCSTLSQVLWCSQLECPAVRPKVICG